MVKKEKQSDETLSPGARLTGLLADRGMKQADLAARIGRPPQYVQDIIKRKKNMDVRVAMELEEALETPKAVQWLEWELMYQRHLLQVEASSQSEGALKRRDVMDEFPFALDAVRRGWIPDNKDPVKLRDGIREFLNSSRAGVNFKFSPKLEAFEGSLKAWTIRASRVLEDVEAEPFKRADRQTIPKLVQALRPLMASENGAEQVPALLAQHGVRFAVLPSLTKAPVDGAAALNDGAPFVIMSLRHGQLDRFWFVLMHELAHIHAGDEAGELVLDNYDERVAPSEKEARADKLASEWILPAETFLTFVRRGDMSLDSIKAFATQQSLHHALVIGRLKSEGWLPWSSFGREHPSVRDHLARGMKISN